MAPKERLNPDSTQASDGHEVVDITVSRRKRSGIMTSSETQAFMGINTKGGADINEWNDYKDVVSAVIALNHPCE